MFKTAFSSVESLAPPSLSNIVVTFGDKRNPLTETSTAMLNEENPDFSDRKRYHHSERTQHDID